MQIRTLLIHSEAVPSEVRDALKAAYFGPPERRCAELTAAARVLRSQTGLAHNDVRELLDLPQCAGF